MSAAKTAKAEKEVKAAAAEKATRAPKAKTAGKKVVDIKDAPQKPASQEKLINLLLAPHWPNKDCAHCQQS